MKRIAVSLALAFDLLAVPLAAEAQQAGKVPRIGYLWLGPSGSETLTLAGLRQGFRELGYVEERDLILESRYADGTPERLPALVADLVRLKVAVILSPGSVVTRAVQQGTSTIPVVSTSGDPVGAGFVKSLARPGGNITGLSLSAGEDSTLAAKQLELLKEVVPTISRVATILNSTNSGPGLRVMQQAAPALGLRLQPVEVRTSADLDRAFAAITAAGAEALHHDSDPLVVSYRARLVEFAMRRRLPAIYGTRDFVDAGGLMMYGPSIADLWRRVAYYMDKILKGAKPGDLPVEQPTKFELMINLRTAKALGLTIPPSVLARADEVIQ